MSSKMDERSSKEIRLHLLKGSQQEHDKIMKDFAYVYGHDHPRVLRLTEERNRITTEINDILAELNKE